MSEGGLLAPKLPKIAAEMICNAKEEKGGSGRGAQRDRGSPYEVTWKTNNVGKEEGLW